MFHDVHRDGMRLRLARAWRSAPVVHAFTDRHGGVSAAPYDALNVGLHVGDDPQLVWENRARVCAALNREPDQLVAGEQVHGNTVAVVTEADKGRGALRTDDSIPGVDALITASPDIMLISFFADCVPILLFDPETPAVGVVHAGWKGTALDTIGAAVKAMREAFGTRAERCSAAIGPSIGPCCYAVGHDVASQLQAAIPGANPNTDSVENSIIIERDDALYADLQRANELLLRQKGILAHNIYTDRLCTRCHAQRFFSYRAAGGTTGRMAALIGL